MSLPAGLTCPECGTHARNERALFRTRRQYARASACFILLLAAVTLPIVERTRRTGWAGLPAKALYVAPLVAYSKPPGATFDGSFQIALRDRVAAGISPFDAALLDRSMALAVRTVTNKPQALADIQVLACEVYVELPRCVEAMQRLARDEHADPAARLAAIQSLSMITMSRPDMLDFWRWVLRNPDFGPAPRSTAAAAIGQMEDAGIPALNDLIAALDDSDSSVVQQAISAIGRFRGAARPALPRLIELLTSPNSLEVSRAMIALSNMGADALVAVPHLTELAATPNGNRRSSAIRTLGWIGPAAEPSIGVLLAAAAPPSIPQVRAAALESLAHILGPLPEHPRRDDATGIMVESLSDPSTLVRMQSLQALFLIGWNPGPRGPEMRQLGDSLKGRASIWGRLLEARAAGTLLTMEDELIALLRPGVDPALSEEQEAAMEALGYLRCVRATDVLRQFCGDIRQAGASADSQLRYFDARRAIHRIETGVRLR